jgi:glyoxylate reductase
MLGNRIWGKRLGIVGMGRIGQAVARRAKAFGLQIHYHNRKPVAKAIEQELRRPIGTASTRCSRAWTS